jgi:hypothetical protein
LEQRISILRGISIDWRKHDENAHDSIRFKTEFDSNDIAESDSHPEKHSEQRISTLREISIDWSEDNENADDSIRYYLEFD